MKVKENGLNTLRVPGSTGQGGHGTEVGGRRSEDTPVEHPEGTRFNRARRAPRLNEKPKAFNGAPRGGIFDRRGKQRAQRNQFLINVSSDTATAGNSRRSSLSKPTVVF